jgi:hypothetical protein
MGSLAISFALVYYILPWRNPSFPFPLGIVAFLLLSSLLSRYVMLIGYDLLAKKSLMEKGYRFDHLARLELYRALGAVGTRQLPSHQEVAAIGGCDPDSVDSLLDLIKKGGFPEAKDGSGQSSSVEKPGSLKVFGLLYPFVVLGGHLGAIYNPKSDPWNRGFIVVMICVLTIALGFYFIVVIPWSARERIPSPVSVPLTVHVALPLFCRFAILIFYDLLAKRGLVDKGYDFDQLERMYLYRTLGAKGISQLPNRDEGAAIPGINPDLLESLVELMSRRKGGD